MDKNGRVLVRAIAELAIFLEFSPESALTSDLAVEAMEQLASTLQTMDESARRGFCSALLDVASRYEGEQAEFVSSLGEALALE